MREVYDVVVIGGGHAGAEAAWAAANLLGGEGSPESLVPRPESARNRNAGHGTRDSGPGRGRVALVTMEPSKVGAMSCNPAIGGLAKGQMVREIDALGGLMGLAADATGIQFKVLNGSKGAAVRGPRCQSDKYAYAREVQRLIGTRGGARGNVEVIAGVVESIEVDAGRVVGVVVDSRRHAGGSEGGPAACRRLSTRAVVLTTGTFMRALMHTGPRKAEGGRVGEGSAVGISAALKGLGLELGRLKTGTPPRLRRGSLDLASLPVQPGDARPVPFSEMTRPEAFPRMKQVDCWMTHTSESVHDLIRSNLDRAPMYNGQIAPGNVGPRYCPSIEDKVVRFADKGSHHVFLEPESLETDEIYCNGISTSLPADVQEKIVHALPGCGKAEILRHGYAVEYDMVPPHQIDATCMTKKVAGLFLAGQINGTSGYEEAAAQGLVAGLNAVRYVRGQDLVRLGREQAYVGVMMDDLVTKTPREPYRMFTSRAEHRLHLRADNAAERLTEMGRELGLVDDARWSAFEAKRRAAAELRAWMRAKRVDGRPMMDWVRRPEVDAEAVLGVMDASLPAACREERLVFTVLADVQYEGYVARHRQEIERLAGQEAVPLPTDEAHDYRAVTGLRTEAALTLNKFRPATLGQAGRLAGVNPTDVMLLSLAMKKRGVSPAVASSSGKAASG